MNIKFRVLWYFKSRFIVFEMYLTWSPEPCWSVCSWLVGLVITWFHIHSFICSTFISCPFSSQSFLSCSILSHIHLPCRPSCLLVILSSSCHHVGLVWCDCLQLVWHGNDHLFPCHLGVWLWFHWSVESVVWPEFVFVSHLIGSLCMSIPMAWPMGMPHAWRASGCWHGINSVQGSGLMS